MDRISNSAVPLTDDLRTKARQLALAGDETRIRILCYLFGTNDTCVSQIAEDLNMSIGVVSHHVRVMRDNGLLDCERRGATVCYWVVKNDLTKGLQKIICG